MGDSGLGVSDIITLSGTIITTAVSTTKELITAFPFMLLPMGFIFGRKFVGIAKSLTMQKRRG